MLDSLTNEVVKPLLRGSKQRLTTVIFLFSLLFAGVEASTQFVSLFLLNRRIETTNRLLEVKGLSAQQTSELMAVQAANINDLKAIDEIRKNPTAYLWSLLKRFAKGVWPTVPFALFVLLLGYKIIPTVPEKGRLIAVAFGFAAFQIVVVFAVANGLISAYWNTSPSFLRSVVVFPILSGLFLTAILAVLLFLEERESKPKEETRAIKALTNLVHEADRTEKSSSQ